MNNALHKLRKLGTGRKTFIIAELSANHNHDIQIAINSIKEAKKAGVDAVKLQAYTPETMTIDVDNKYFRVKHPKWGGQTLYQLYQKAYTPWEWFRKLKVAADREGILLFSSAFDKTSVKFLEELKMPVYKIASFELVDLDLIKCVARTKKPLIMSTGMASKKEIQEAVAAAKSAGAREIILLKCVSSYPAHPKTMHLNTIPDLAKMTGCPVGLSDHSLGSTVAVAAVALGAVVIEKHFTLSRKLKTPDSFFSMEPQEWRKMVEEVRVVEDALGDVHYGCVDDEKNSKIFRRSLFVVEDIKTGEKFTESNVRSIRPAGGLAPKYLPQILGKRAMRDVRRGTPVTINLFRNSA
jgi:pseudaminic acid synthase